MSNYYAPCFYRIGFVVIPSCLREIRILHYFHYNGAMVTPNRSSRPELLERLAILESSHLRKRCFENMPQIYRRTPMPKCDFNEVAFHNHFCEFSKHCNISQKTFPERNKIVWQSSQTKTKTNVSIIKFIIDKFELEGYCSRMV